MKNLSASLKNLEWINVAFLFLSPLIAVAGTVFLIQHGGIRWPTVIFSVCYAIATGMAVTAGYHRLFAHRSYAASRLLKSAMLLLGAASFENSARMWSSDHRNHHKYVDTDLDPYNIKKGFWYAHMGWILFKRPNSDCANVSDLDKEPLIRLQDRFYFVIAIVMGFGVPAAIGSLWHDALGSLILAGFVRIVLNHHFTFSINSICHYMGKQPYSDRNSSRDSWLPAFLTYGEGYHNYHHTFPSDYRNAVRAYQWDPTKWLIRALEWTKLTYHLNRIDAKKILEVRIRMDEKRLLEKVVRAGEPHLMKDLIASARMKLEEAFSRFQALRSEYLKAKAGKIDSFNAQWMSLSGRIKVLKRNMRGKKKEFKAALASWRHLCRQPMGGTSVAN